MSYFINEYCILKPQITVFKFYGRKEKKQKWTFICTYASTKKFPESLKSAKKSLPHLFQKNFKHFFAFCIDKI